MSTWHRITEQLQKAEEKKNVFNPFRFLEMVYYERQDLQRYISAIFLITNEDEKSCDYLTVYVPCPPCWASVHHGVGAAPGLGCAGDQRETQEDHGGKEGKWSWKNGGWFPLAFSSHLVLPFIKWERRRKNIKWWVNTELGWIKQQWCWSKEKDELLEKKNQKNQKNTMHL